MEGQQPCLKADMVIGAAIALWGSILQGDRVQRLLQREPTADADKVTSSVTRPIILNIINISSQWPYNLNPPMPSHSCSFLLFGICSRMAHVSLCLGTYYDGGFLLFVHQLEVCYWSTQWYNSSNIDCLLLCMLAKSRSALTHVWKRDKNRGVIKEKEVSVYQNKAEKLVWF